MLSGFISLVHSLPLLVKEVKLSRFYYEDPTPNLANFFVKIHWKISKFKMAKWHAAFYKAKGFLLYYKYPVYTNN